MIRPSSGCRIVFKSIAAWTVSLAIMGVAVDRLPAQEGNSQARITQAFKDLRNSNPYTRRDAINVLAETGMKKYAGDIAGMLRDEEEVVIISAIEALKKLGAKEFAGDLVPLLRDEKFRVRADAVEGLADWGARKYAAEISLLLRDDTAFIRGDAAQALAKLGAREYAPDIITLLKDNDGSVRKSAVEALQRLNVQPSVADVFKISSDAVVRIETLCEKGTRRGAGFLVSVDGRIATNRHVVSPPAKAGLGRVEQITVQFRDGRSFTVVDTRIHPRYDLALLKIQNPPQGLFYLHFARETPLVGEEIIIIGHPVGLSWSLSSGRVSQIRDDPDGGRNVWIQTDGTINSGNSGGPMLNRYAQVIGIATKSIIGEGDDIVTGLNFGITATVANEWMFYGRQ